MSEQHENNQPQQPAEQPRAVPAPEALVIEPPVTEERATPAAEEPEKKSKKQEKKKKKVMQSLTRAAPETVKAIFQALTPAPEVLTMTERLTSYCSTKHAYLVISV